MKDTDTGVHMIRKEEVTSQTVIRISHVKVKSVTSKVEIVKLKQKFIEGTEIK